MNRLGRGRFKAWSAGSHPTGRINPFARETLGRMGLPVDGLRSKSWDEFARPDAPALDFIFTVCDRAAGEVCPLWPGRPMTAHWGIEDPAACKGSDEEVRRVFQEAALMLRRRIRRARAGAVSRASRRQNGRAGVARAVAIDRQALSGSPRRLNESPQATARLGFTAITATVDLPCSEQRGYQERKTLAGASGIRPGRRCWTRFRARRTIPIFESGLLFTGRLMEAFPCK